MLPLALTDIHVAGWLDQRLHLALAHLLAERGRILGGEGFGQAWGADQQGRWIGAVALASQLTGQPLPVLDETVQRFIATQAPDGFFGGTCNSLTWWGAGRGLIGLLEYWQVSQDAAALQAAVRLGEFYLKHFPLEGPGLTTHHGGHEEGLVALWRATGRDEFLALAKKIPATVTDPFGTPGDKASAQHTHSYLCTTRGWVDLYLATGEAQFLQRAVTVWEHVLRHQMWVTGGISEGSAYTFETRDETCSVADWLRLTLKLWQATQERRYLEVAEHVLLNHLSFDQDHTGGFCAFRSVGENPAGQVRDMVAWFCCSMHGLRAMLEAVRFIYSQTDNTLAVNLFISSRAQAHLPAGLVRVTQAAESPLGPVRLTLAPEAPCRFTLQVRIPAWARGWQMTLNGQPVDTAAAGGAVTLERTWQPGDTLELSWQSGLRVVPAGANSFGAPARAAAQERAALMVGPLVLMLDPALNCYEMFEWDRAELLIPQSAEDTPYLTPLPAHLLGRGALAVPGAGFMTLARSRGGAADTAGAPLGDEAWKIAFLVPVAEITDRWTASNARLVPYEIRNDLRRLAPAEEAGYQAALQARFQAFTQQRQADTSVEGH